MSRPNDIPFDIHKKHRLTDKQAHFLTLYIRDGFKNVSKNYKIAYGHPLTPSTTNDRNSSKLLNTQKMQTVLAEIIHRKSGGDKDARLTVDTILSTVETILKDETNKALDRIKAAEILLKHQNAFKQHNESKSSKILNIAMGRSKEELVEDIKNLQRLIHQTDRAENLLEQKFTPSELLDADFEEIK